VNLTVYPFAPIGVLRSCFNDRWASKQCGDITRHNCSCKQQVTAQQNKAVVLCTVSSATKQTHMHDALLSQPLSDNSHTSATKALAQALASSTAQHPMHSMLLVCCCCTCCCCCPVRRGTPRQPHLVPAARAALQLAPGVPATCLRGLEGFTHCWVLYVFHENTGGDMNAFLPACLLYSL